MTKFMRRIAVLLCICLMAPTVLNCIPNVNVNTTAEAMAAAKTKAKLYTKKGSIGIASTPEYIYIEDQNYDAKYTFTSSNKKIVTVDKNGKLTGVAKGTAKITVKETYKKKTVNVGTFTVSVVNSKLSSKSIEVPLFASYYLPLEYRNYKAKYSGEVADPTIATVNEDGLLVGLKEGKTTVTISETYKKKTRKLGNLTVTVKAPSINPESAKVTLGVNQITDPFSLIYIDDYSWNTAYTFESADPTIVSVNQVSEDGYIYQTLKGEKVGTTTMTVAAEYQGEKVTVGTVEVTVAEIPVTSFGFDSDYKDENNTFTKTFYIGDDDYNYLNYYLLKEPYNATTPVTFTSSDPSIATVDADGKVKALKEGTVEITATCGTFSDKAVITIESEY